MKSLIIYKTCLLAALLSAGIVRAQVGTGTQLPDKSAALDLSSGQAKGLLLPRVKLLSLTDSTTIATGHPAKGLLLYNTNTALPDGKGFYQWTGKSWLILSGDNLGNHQATQGLALNGNSVSNDGTNTKGLIFDDPGNAAFKQQLTIKSYATIASTDNILSVNASGLAEKAIVGDSFVTADNFARKAPLSTPVIAPGDSASVTAGNIRTATYMVVVTVNNACGRTGLSVFMISNNAISFMGGQARDARYTVTAVPGFNGSRLRLDTGMVSCEDGGGGNQFGFTIMVLPGNIIRIVNSGSLINQTYQVTVTET